MRFSKQFILSTLLVGSLFSGIMGCGEGTVGSDPDTSTSTLSITPSGTTLLKKDQILDFNANLADATFSVEGGAANGSIDANGLYTPPSTLPVNNRITIKASSGDQNATATVNLMTNDSVALNAASKKQVGDSEIFLPAFSLDAAMNLSRHRLAVSDANSNHQVAVNWQSFDGVDLNSSFDLMTNLSSFGTDKAAALPASNPYTGTIGYGPDGSLFIVQMEMIGAKLALKVYSTQNEGVSYNSHLVHSDPAFHTFAPSLSISSDNTLHLVFTKGDSPVSAQKAFYTKSSDAGATWSSPLEINSVSPEFKLQPDVAANSTGNEVNLCWTESSAGQFDIYYARSNDGGNTFGTAVRVSNTPAAREGQCQVRHGLNHEAYVLYSGINILSFVENLEILIAKTNDGISFAPAVQVNSDAFHLHTFPHMSVDALGRIDVIWAWDKDGDGSDIYETIYHSRSLDGGNTFSANDVFVQDAVGTATVPMGLVHDAAGRLHYTFIQREGAGFYLFYQMAE